MLICVIVATRDGQYDLFASFLVLVAPLDDDGPLALLALCPVALHRIDFALDAGPDLAELPLVHFDEARDHRIPTMEAKSDSVRMRIGMPLAISSSALRCLLLFSWPLSNRMSRSPTTSKVVFGHSVGGLASGFGRHIRRFAPWNGERSCEHDDLAKERPLRVAVAGHAVASIGTKRAFDAIQPPNQVEIGLRHGTHQDEPRGPCVFNYVVMLEFDAELLGQGRQPVAFLGALGPCPAGDARSVEPEALGGIDFVPQ